MLGKPVLKQSFAILFSDFSGAEITHFDFDKQTWQLDTWDVIIIVQKQEKGV